VEETASLVESLAQNGLPGCRATILGELLEIVVITEDVSNKSNIINRVRTVIDRAKPSEAKKLTIYVCKTGEQRVVWKKKFLLTGLLPPPPPPTRKAVLRRLGYGCLGLIGIFVVLRLNASILYPIFFQMAIKAQQAEAKVTLAAWIRDQMAYHTEKGDFASDFEKLPLFHSTETKLYSYKIVPQPDKNKSMMITAKSKKFGLRSYSAAVFQITQKNSEVTSVGGICQTNEPGSTPPSIPIAPRIGSTVKCPAGSHLLE